MKTEVGEVQQEEFVAPLLPVAFEAVNLEKLFKQVEEEVKAEVPDVTTEDGRARIRAMAMKVSKSKTALDKPMRDYLRAIKAFPKVVEKNARESVERFDALRDEILAPLNLAAESQNEIISTLESIPGMLLEPGLTAAEANNLLLMVDDQIDMSIVWEENLKKANSLRDAALKLCGDAVARLEQAEAQAAELAELRRKQQEAEQRERERQIAEEARQRAEREAEEKTRRDRQDADRRASEARAREEAAVRENQRLIEQQQRDEQRRKDEEAQRAALEEQRQKEEKERREREVKQAAEDERKRLEEEQRKIEEQAERRAADKAHRTAINRDILVAMLANTDFNDAVKSGDPETIAKAVITMAAKRHVGRMIVDY